MALRAFRLTRPSEFDGSYGKDGIIMTALPQTKSSQTEKKLSEARNSGTKKSPESLSTNKAIMSFAPLMARMVS